MAFFIKVDENNSPIGFPATQGNLEMAFPAHDWSGGPMAGWLEFVHTPINIKEYQKFDETVGADLALAYTHNGLEYKLIDGKIKEVWHLIDLTEDEKKAVQDKVKANWAAQDPPGPTSWVFNEANCAFEPPIPLPSDAVSDSNPDGKRYRWNEPTTSWVT
tara:strand:+ start:1247 stop:1726 length:480 start_codon:yes stop_codon:yes gene_type:complete